MCRAVARLWEGRERQGPDVGHTTLHVSPLSSLQCQICRSTFICTSTVVKLKEHADNKHPKNVCLGQISDAAGGQLCVGYYSPCVSPTLQKFEECFPGHEA